jgi:hypothetical protein
MNTEYERGYVDGHKAGCQLATNAFTEASHGEVVEAITDMQEGRESHQKWLDHLSSPQREDCQGCNDHAEHIGDVEHHRQWIDKYDRAIRLLALVPLSDLPAVTPTDEVERLRMENELCRRAFETDDLLRIPEVGNLNALQIVKKLAELANALTEARAKAIAECVEAVKGQGFEWTGNNEWVDAADEIAELLESLTKGG